MKKWTLAACALLSCLIGSATPLKFRSNGTFKIAQITDVHFKNNDPASSSSLTLFDELIEKEKPDLVIFTGDVVVEPAPVLEGWKKVLAPFQKAGIPFAVALGNHDDEHDKNRESIVKFLEKQPGCLNRKRCFTLPIYGASAKTAALLYIFDSNSYSTIPNVSGYGWIDHQQVSWYIGQSSKHKKHNKGAALPALAFFHIPIPEYCAAANSKEYPLVGFRGENECTQSINTGLFAAMLNQGDVMGCFVGHDHENDYMAFLNGISLAYGRKTSAGTSYGDLKCGSRIITLTEGSRSFSSYIYEQGGTIVQQMAFPRPLRFAITADTHFDPGPETDQFKNVVALNKLPLDGVAIVGDVFDRQAESVIPLFKKRYEKGDGDSTLHAQLYIGLGNHDINPVSTDEKQNLRERAATLHYVDSLLNDNMQKGLLKSWHKPTRCYSFDLNGIHFIQTHTWAGDTTLGKGGLEWLEGDLRSNQQKKLPVILLMHYTFDENDLRWISKQERDTLYERLKGHNILAIFNGHDHQPSQTTWNGIKVFTADNAWKDTPDQSPSFYYLEYTPNNSLSVKQCFWDNTTMNLTIKQL